MTELPATRGSSEVVSTDPAHRPGLGAVVVVLCADRFARLRLWEGGAKAAWLEEPLQLPGCCAGLSSRGGTPAACWVEGRGSEEATDDQKKARGRQSVCMVLKGETALSYWDLVL